MGDWGTGAFENDVALDWVWELEDAPDDRLLETALSAVAAADDQDVDADEATIALAAAEVVAAAHGRPAADLPREVVAWVASHGGTVRSDLSDVAVAAVRRVLAGSELQELWGESEHYAAWQSRVRELEGRLVG